jgi:hypothetical protein
VVAGAPARASYGPDAGGTLQSPNLVWCELAPLAWFETTIGERSDSRPLQPADRVPHGFEHPANLAVAPFAYRHTEDAFDVAPLGFEQGHDGRLRSSAIEWYPVPQTREGTAIGATSHACFVSPFDTVAGMREPRRQIAVIGQEQQPFGVVVEATDRVHVLPDAPEKIENRSASLGIGSSADVAGGFVQEDVATPLDGLDPAPVHANVVQSGTGLRAHLRYGASVDRDTPLEDQFLGCSPGRDTGLREDLLEPNTVIASDAHRFTPNDPNDLIL